MNDKPIITRPPWAVALEDGHSDPRTEDARWAEIVHCLSYAHPARVGDHTVRCVSIFLTCPYCSRIVGAQNVHKIDDGFALTCNGCHRDVITIKSRPSDEGLC